MWQKISEKKVNVLEIVEKEGASHKQIFEMCC